MRLPESSTGRSPIHAPRRASLLVVALAIPTRHHLRVAGDRAIDFDAVAEAQGGVEFGDLAEDADFLRGEVDVWKHL